MKSYKFFQAGFRNFVQFFLEEISMAYMAAAWKTSSKNFIGSPQQIQLREGCEILSLMACDNKHVANYPTRY